MTVLTYYIPLPCGGIKQGPGFKISGMGSESPDVPQVLDVSRVGHGLGFRVLGGCKILEHGVSAVSSVRV